MNLIILVILVIVGVSLRKRFRGFDVLVIAYLTYLSYTVRDIPDFNIYKLAYNYISSGNYYTDLGVGWYYICHIGASLGADYATVKAAVALVSLLLIRSAINSFSISKNYTGLCWALYLIYPALLDIVQIRFLLAEAISIFALRFLLSEKRGSDIWYIVLIGIAFLVHSSSIFYLVFLFRDTLGARKGLVWLITGIETVIIVAGGSIVINVASVFVNDGRIDRYFHSSESLGVFGALAYIFTLVVFQLLTEKIAETVQVRGADSSIVRLSLFVRNLARLSWFILPLTFFDTNFFRLQRPMWLLLFVEVSAVLGNGISRLRISGYDVSIRDVALILSLVANIFFICIFAFSIIKAFLI